MDRIAAIFGDQAGLAEKRPITVPLARAVLAQQERLESTPPT